MNISEEEAYNTIKKSVEAINTRPYATKAEYEKVECIKVLLTAYEKEKEKNKKLEKELEKHIKFCEQEAEGSLNNKICHISLKFNKKLLNILKEEK